MEGDHLLSVVVEAAGGQPFCDAGPLLVGKPAPGSCCAHLEPVPEASTSEGREVRVWVGRGTQVSFHAMPATSFARESPCGTPARGLGRCSGHRSRRCRNTQPGKPAGGGRTDAGARVEKDRREELNDLVWPSATENGVHSRCPDADAGVVEVR